MSSSAAVKASYIISYHIAKQMKPHTIREILLMPCMKEVVGIVIRNEHVRTTQMTWLHEECEKWRLMCKAG